MQSLDVDLADFSRAIVRGAAPSPKITQKYQNYSIEVAIEVYRNNYRGNLHDALAGAYPVTEQLVGSVFFRLLTRSFIEKHPSRSGNLHRYGSEMKCFLASFAPAKELAYLPDVAALEWACHCAYFVDDAVALELSKLGQVPPDQYPGIILHLHPACLLVRSSYPIAAIWHAHQPGADSDFHIDLDSGACNALVSRKNDEVQVGELSMADADWLQFVQAGSPLGAATEFTQERYPDFNLESALLGLVARDVIADFELGAMS
jgi:hypothetical protein